MGYTLDMRSSQMLKIANIIDVPDMGGAAIKRKPLMPAGSTHYLTGEQQFKPGVEPSFLGATANTAGGLARVSSSPFLGLLSAGGKGPGRESGLAGMTGSAVDALGNAFKGNWQGAKSNLRQLGKDVNLNNPQGAWSKATQRHAGKGYEDATRQIPNWWNYPGGFWEQWGSQAQQGAARKPSTAL